MTSVDRTHENSTHTIAPEMTITERPDLEVGVTCVSGTIRGGLNSGEHYSREDCQDFS
jgi:hypothetical protein